MLLYNGEQIKCTNVIFAELKKNICFSIRQTVVKKPDGYAVGNVTRNLSGNFETMSGKLYIQRMKIQSLQKYLSLVNGDRLKICSSSRSPVQIRLSARKQTYLSSVNRARLKISSGSGSQVQILPSALR